MQHEPTRRTSTSVGWRLARTAVLVLGGVWLLSLALVILWERLDTRRSAHAIVVLGAAQWDGRPSPVLRARVDHAIQLWRRGLAPRLIVTGGRGLGDTTSEAAVELRYAISHGIPASAIIVEAESRTTSESLRNVAAMMKPGERDVILVSDPF